MMICDLLVAGITPLLLFFHLCFSGLASKDHPSRRITKKKALPYPKSAEEKVSYRIAVAKRTGRLDLASNAVRLFPPSSSGGANASSDGISDMSTNGASEQLIDRIPPQQQQRQGQRQSAGEDEADRYMEDITQDASGITLYEAPSSLLDDNTVYVNLTALPSATFKIKGRTSFNMKYVNRCLLISCYRS